MRTVYILSTGGTIEKVYSEQTGHVQNLRKKVDRYLRRLRLPDTRVRVVPLMNKDSLEMTAADRAKVLRQVRKLLAHHAPIVITHGTDTMVETGKLLREKLPQLRVPIVMTGAMTPLGFEASDGLQNLTESLIASRLLAPGVYVVMHGQVFPVDAVRKDRRRARFVWISPKGGRKPPVTPTPIAGSDGAYCYRGSSPLRRSQEIPSKELRCLPYGKRGSAAVVSQPRHGCRGKRRLRAEESASPTVLR